MVSSPRDIEERLEETRRRLLDLTRRNRLLNHRVQGRATLRIVDEMPEEIFRLLVIEGRTLQFLAREEAPAAAAATVNAQAAIDDSAESYDVGADARQAQEYDEVGSGLGLAPIAPEGQRSAHYSDHNLQTALDGEKLQARLLHLSREAASAREEQGTNILYLTLGVVEWQDQAGGQVCRAPLLFVPADLERKSVQSRFSLRLFEDDIVVNPSLAELCVRVFGFELPHFDADEQADLPVFFAAVAQALPKALAWRFAAEIHLGLFSFAKLLMYRDLDPASWPAGKSLADHPLVRRLSGFAPHETEPQITAPDPRTLDSSVPLAETYQVVDADSSQQVAILLAKRGASAVIEGPPGTGKSQTITNIIAECLAEGKTVLFVAEKAAALDVVRRRLESAGLGDFALELHSHKASKRAVLDELQRTLAGHERSMPPRDTETQELERVRARLNSYVDALHTPLGALALTPFAAMARAIALAAAPEAPVLIEQPLRWSAQRLDSAREQLDALDRRRRRVGEPATHPWRGIGLISFGVEARQQLERALHGLRTALHDLAAATAALAGQLGVAVPQTLAGAQLLLTTAAQLLAQPQLAPALVVDSRWDIPSPELRSWLDAGLRREQQKALWSRYVVAAAEDVDWREMLARRKEHQGSLVSSVLPGSIQDWALRRLLRAWHADAQRLDQHLLPEVKPGLEEQLALLEALVESAALKAELVAGVSRFEDQLGPHMHGIDGDWQQLRQVAEAAAHVRRLVLDGLVSISAAQRIVSGAGRSELAAVIGTIQGCIERAEQAWSDWYTTTASDERLWLGGDWAALDLASMQARLEELPSAIEQVEDWIELRRLISECSAGPLAAFTNWALGPEGGPAQGQLAASFTRQFYRLWIDHAIAERPALCGFHGQEHETLIGRFRSADRQWIEDNRRRVAELIRGKRPDFSHEAHRHSKLGILKAEMRKKRRHMPLRKLFALGGDVVQSIKPCFMMSPISIAQYLEPGAVGFDVVIFDEASQVEPADAYGAIARGRQLLLVGDENQLPPTSFFSKIESGDGLADEEGFAAADLESILSLGVVRLPQQCALRWHYRSRHASLIEFSNQRFYDGRLRVFPGPYTGNDEFGLVFRYVEGGVYMRGAGQHNPAEARLVAQEAMRHSRMSPHLSLGIGAFSVAQQRAIEDEIERLRRTSPDPQIERFFATKSSEPFFVKNLETIQGDERDVILLSVGYGRDQQGKLSMNFGPLNREGGWRRLNVLVTRARQRCLLFSSIRADDINLGSTQARGVVALKEYLHLAEHGQLVAAARPTGQHDSPFEAAVCQALRERGWEVHTQVGSAGFWIDLAVVNPDRPGRYLLGIECDGATYHSSATARDRDRLRQQVLEDLGWTIARVWSADWFNRPASTLAQLVARIEAVYRAQREPQAAPVTIALDPDTRDTETIATIRLDRSTLPEPAPAPATEPLPQSTNSSGAQPYLRASAREGTSAKTLATIPPTALAAVIDRIVRVEGPIHVEEAQRVVAGFLGTRVSKRLQEAFESALANVIAHGLVIRRKQFLWSPGMTVPPVRYRGDGCPVTQPELIAPEEMQAAVVMVLTQAFGMQREALIASTTRLFGFRRVGAHLEAAVNAAIDHLLSQGALAYDQQAFLVLVPAN